MLNVDNRRRGRAALPGSSLAGALIQKNYPDDEGCIEPPLLDKSHRVENGQIIGSPSKDYESLKNDWDRRGQETPFWIRPNGTVCATVIAVSLGSSECNERLATAG